MISHRYTTSSRTPGVVRHGTVHVKASGLRRCDDCGVFCMSQVLPGEHAPHLVPVAGGELVLVNCVGQPIPPRSEP